VNDDDDDNIKVGAHLHYSICKALGIKTTVKRHMYTIIVSSKSDHYVRSVLCAANFSIGRELSV
jgi:hypothetical protein